ncbi:MAG: peptide-methionine (S)-S-oxide reductase MsrA [Actinobacteria bacterium]|uniref:peptide-methionine (S)-S-oxide reductase n=1 Tax=freshwater metagenome TaxID=449393 RepID=A0A6J6F3H5_9ZZZZ|nr:peptide-methionine (S)-S-oxide reductase MsrA [Actinomycetota bacterium]
MSIFSRPVTMPSAASALPGRSSYSYPIPATHRVLGTALQAPYPAGYEVAYFGMGCFWGVERLFWQLPGIHTTAAGYQGGFTTYPNYEEVCTGRTGHAETVLVVFDPTKISYQDLLIKFWEEHDPTSGMRQGNDVGTQYRSTIYTTSTQQLELAQTSKLTYQNSLANSGLGEITTEIMAAPEFYFAEEYHQQYLDRVPNGYCGLKGTGVRCI